MFERFTDRARDVLVQAGEEAKLLNHNYFGTEHFLLAMFALDEDDPAHEALASIGVTYDMVRGEVLEIVGIGKAPVAPPIPLTPFGKRSLELALRQSIQLNQTYIEPAHILLGILDAQRRDEANPIAAQALLSLEVDLDELRYAAIKATAAHGAASA
jgi:ATP-dependent Clp protease ATP-binding subunit ClpC